MEGSKRSNLSNLPRAFGERERADVEEEPLYLWPLFWRTVWSIPCENTSTEMAQGRDLITKQIITRACLLCEFARTVGLASVCFLL